MYVSRQNCQWNQKGLLDAYRMRDGVAWCQSSAQWLVLGTSLNVRQMYLSGNLSSLIPRQPCQEDTLSLSQKWRGGIFRILGSLFTLQVFAWQSVFLREVKRARISCLSLCISQPSDCPSLWQQHMQCSQSAGCSSCDLPLSWTSWDIHFAFLEMNNIFAMCGLRGPDALFRRQSGAGRV